MFLLISIDIILKGFEGFFFFNKLYCFVDFNGFLNILRYGVVIYGLNIKVGDNLERDE